MSLVDVNDIDNNLHYKDDNDFTCDNDYDYVVDYDCDDDDDDYDDDESGEYLVVQLWPLEQMKTSLTPFHHSCACNHHHDDNDNDNDNQYDDDAEKVVYFLS